jgi:hypothetical protein
MIKCCKCKTHQPEEKFSWRNKELGKRRDVCKECHRAYLKEHYQKNKEKYMSKSKAYKQMTRGWVRELKAKSVCERCGENHPATLDFHHKDPTKKDGSIYKMAQQWSIARLKKEIEKCIILCSNCHRKHHWNPVI